MERKIVNRAKKMTPKETVKRIICRVIHNYYGLEEISAAVEYDSDINMWNFEIYGFEKWGTNWLLISGYVGSLGQIVVTGKDGKLLKINECEEVLS